MRIYLPYFPWVRLVCQFFFLHRATKCLIAALAARGVGRLGIPPYHRRILVRRRRERSCDLGCHVRSPPGTFFCGTSRSTPCYACRCPGVLLQLDIRTTRLSRRRGTRWTRCRTERTRYWRLSPVTFGNRGYSLPSIRRRL